MFILLKKIYIDSVHFHPCDPKSGQKIPFYEFGWYIPKASPVLSVACLLTNNPTQFTKITNSVGQIKIKEKQKIWE